MDKAKKIVIWLGARLREPSTYAGIATLIAAFHFGHGGEWSADITSIGMGVGGVIAIVLPEIQ